MANLNKVMLMGNLTRDPVNRATSTGMMICDFGLAINRHFKTAQGEDREEVCFVDIEAFGKTAELCARYLHRGSLAYVEGRLKLDQWVDKNTGQNRNRLRVTVETIQFLERRQDAANPQNVSYDGQGNAMMPPPQMAMPGVFQSPPQQKPAVAAPSSVQEVTDGPPLSVYEEEAGDQDIPF